jgi:hypothetical protein
VTQCVYEDKEHERPLIVLPEVEIGFGDVLPEKRWCWYHARWEDSK